MKILCRLAVIAALCLPTFAHAQSTDAFTGTVLSKNWTVLSGSFTVSGGQVWGAGASDLAYYSGATFTSDQWSCFTLAAQSPKSGTQIGPAVRISPKGDSWYWVKINGGTATITAQANGAWQGAITGAIGVVAGHEYCLFATGTTISLTDSATPGSAGITALSVANSSIASGSPGMQQVAAPGSGNNLSAFRAGPATAITAPPPVVTPPPVVVAPPVTTPTTATPVGAPTPAMAQLMSDGTYVVTLTAPATVVPQ